MSLNSSGRTSSSYSVYPDQLYQITGLNSTAYRNFCQELKIKNLYSTPQNPQSNGQAEASNKTILTDLKKRLDSAKGKWVDELPGVL